MLYNMVKNIKEYFLHAKKYLNQTPNKSIKYEFENMKNKIEMDPINFMIKITRKRIKNLDLIKYLNDLIDVNFDEDFKHFLEENGKEIIKNTKIQLFLDIPIRIINLNKDERNNVFIQYQFLSFFNELEKVINKYQIENVEFDILNKLNLYGFYIHALKNVFINETLFKSEHLDLFLIHEFIHAFVDDHIKGFYNWKSKQMIFYNELFTQLLSYIVIEKERNYRINRNLIKLFNVFIHSNEDIQLFLNFLKNYYLDTNKLEEYWNRSIYFSSNIPYWTAAYIYEEYDKEIQLNILKLLLNYMRENATTKT